MSAEDINIKPLPVLIKKKRGRPPTVKTDIII